MILHHSFFWCPELHLTLSEALKPRICFQLIAKLDRSLYFTVPYTLNQNHIFSSKIQFSILDFFFFKFVNIWIFIPKIFWKGSRKSTIFQFSPQNSLLIFTVHTHWSKIIFSIQKLHFYFQYWISFSSSQIFEFSHQKYFEKVLENIWIFAPKLLSSRVSSHARIIKNKGTCTSTSFWKRF